DAVRPSEHHRHDGRQQHAGAGDDSDQPAATDAAGNTVGLLKSLAGEGARAPNATADSKIWQVILAAVVGTMIEWYDFFLFGSLAVVLASKFYPPGNATFAYLAYLATFAIGLVVRPFGALFFGRIGDLVGRKYAFLVTLVLMGGATTA